MPVEATVRPLEGITVLELGTMVAGPFCGRMLADFGAEVIKVEIASGDPVRSMGKRVDGKSLYAASIFRNKKMVSIDLRTDKGRDLVRDMVRKVDVLIENFRPGTMERWDLGFEDLTALNPRLVMVRISGFGQTGPYSQRAGYGIIGESMSGLRHLTRDPDRPPSPRPPMPRPGAGGGGRRRLGEHRRRRQVPALRSRRRGAASGGGAARPPQLSSRHRDGRWVARRERTRHAAQDRVLSPQSEPQPDARPAPGRRCSRCPSP